MQIAYLIIAHHNFAHLQRLIDGLNHEGARFFVHVDLKAGKLPELKGPVQFIKRQGVFWGGFSQVEVTLQLMAEANRAGNFDYFILLSGVDYPLRSNSYFKEKLQSEKGEYINIQEGFQTTKPEKRLTKYHFQHLHRRNKTLISVAARMLENLVFGLGLRRKVNFKPFVGSNWFALSKACVSYIFDFLKQNPQFQKSFSYSLCADEVFFHSIIGNSPFYQKCRHNLTYTDWQVANPPAVINERHVEHFMNNREVKDSYGTFEPFFARKFTDDSADLVAKIDSELRGSKPLD